MGIAKNSLLLKALTALILIYAVASASAVPYHLGSFSFSSAYEVFIYQGYGESGKFNIAGASYAFAISFVLVLSRTKPNTGLVRWGNNDAR